MTRILYTEQQKNDMVYPTRREVLKENHKRNGLSKKLVDEYNRLESGHKGEQLVWDYFKEYGNSNWTIMQNVWLDYYGEYEIDLLLITNSCIYTFEIKHFSGTYEFKNNQCIRNGQRIGHNAISQAQKSFINTQNLFKRNGFNQVIHGGIIFTGEHFEVIVHDEMADLKVLTTNQLREFIYEVVHKENSRTYHHIDRDEVLNRLNQFAISNPFPPSIVTDEISSRIHRGVICSNCSARGIYSRNNYLECKCGMYEPRENAIIRTICEYGIIHFDKNLTTGSLEHFFNGEVNRRTLFIYLNNYFKRLGTGKGTHYENIRKSLYEVSDQFDLKRSRYFRC